MPGETEEDEDLLKPVWLTEDDEPPPRRRRQTAVEPDYDHPLLAPLATAQDVLTRLQTRVEMASPAVRDGLRMRLSYREAAGWLEHAHFWIHPDDLCLRDRGLAASYGAAFRSGRLDGEIPATSRGGSAFEIAPSDIFVGHALHLARFWRRLGEIRSWRPLRDREVLAEVLANLGSRGSRAEAEIAEWQSLAEDRKGPVLIRCGVAFRDWMNRPGIAPRGADGAFLAACLWREANPKSEIALPFWAAPSVLHHRLELHVGVRGQLEFLGCVAAAARVGLQELERLQKAEGNGRSLGRTARSRLPDGFELALRLPLITVRDVREKLKVSRQAAVLVLRQLEAAGVIRETTGRAGWRAYGLA